MNKAKKIILFDDDALNLKLYTEYLREDHACFGYLNPLVYESALEKNPDLIILDVNIPILSGPELYQKIISHENYNGCPIVFISASPEDEVLLPTLKSGGLDFFSRTTGKEEILYRVRNLIQYYRNNRMIFKLGEVKIDMKNIKASLHDQTVDLTLTELKILKTLISIYPEIITRAQLISEIWPDVNVQNQTLNTHLSNLRNKFKDWSYEITNIKNEGYTILLKGTQNENR